jgi:hypothetical protein
MVNSNGAEFDLSSTCQAGVAGQVRGADQAHRPGPAGIGIAPEEAPTCEVIDTWPTTT